MVTSPDFFRKRMAAVNALKRNYAMLSEMQLTDVAFTEPSTLKHMKKVTASKLSSLGVEFGDIGEKIQTRLRRDDVRIAEGKTPLRRVGRHRR